MGRGLGGSGWGGSRVDPTLGRNRNTGYEEGGPGRAEVRVGSRISSQAPGHRLDVYFPDTVLCLLPLFLHQKCGFGSSRAECCTLPTLESRKHQSWAQGRNRSWPWVASPPLSGGTAYSAPSAPDAGEGTSPLFLRPPPSTAGSLSLPPGLLQPAQHLN